MDVKDCNISNDQSIVFKCDICPLTFRSSSARNLHILDHCEKIPCSICHQILVQLGDNWYGPHEHVGQSLIKSEANSDEANECRMEPIEFAFSSEPSHDPSSTKSDDDSICTEPTESDIDKENSSVDTEIKLNSFNASEYTLENQTDSVGIPDTVEHKPIAFIDVPVDGEKSTHDLGSSEVDDKTENIVTKVKTNRKRKQKCSKPKKKQKTVATTQDCWKCDVCSVEFSFEANLIEHKNVCRQEENAVSNEMPQDEQDSNTEPNDVDDNFDDTSSIDSNDRNRMSSTPKREKGIVGGACDVCNKKFVRKSALKYHMNIHLGVKPFKCEECEKAYTYKRQLVNHRRIHEQLKDSNLQNMDNLEIVDSMDMDMDMEKFKLTEEQLKSLTCPLCNKKCPGKSRLETHMNVHKRTRYICKLCHSSFNTIANYRFHDESAHQKTREVIVRAIEDNEATYFACEYCNTDFELELRFARHLLKEHSEEKPDHLCYICSEQFNRSADLLVHMKAHPESNQHKCTVDGCYCAFAYKAGLSVHLEKHKKVNGTITRKTQIDLSEATKQLAMITLNGPSETGEDNENSLTCNSCLKEFPSKTSLVTHIKSHRRQDTSNERIKCTVAGCNKEFKGKRSAYRHISVHHPEAIKECDICQKIFYTEAKLAEHRMKHDKTNNGLFACNICSKTFQLKMYLLNHLSVKHEKEFVCNVCNEKFASAKQMMAHRVKHGKKQTITCRFAGCNKTFDNRRDFAYHTLEHPDKEKKKCICPFCGKGVSPYNLNDHINVHKGITPHKCKHCDKEFARKSSLRRHSLIHTNIKPYSCDIDGCNQTYRDKIDLNRHKFSVHKIYTKKHICSICSKVFPEKKLLTKHTINAHNKVQQA